MSNKRELPKNPLTRDGVSQRQRPVSALSPNSIQVDERDLADFLVFAHRLSEQVIYYNSDSQADGNWQNFFEGNTPIQIALISKTRPQIIKDQYTQKLAAFLDDRTPARLTQVLQSWKDILTKIKFWYKGLEPYTPLKSAIAGLVKTNLRQPLVRMQAFELGYGAIDGQFYEEFTKVFELKIDAPVMGDRTPLTATPKEARSELDAVFQVLLQTYRQIVQQAPSYLQSSLRDRQDHQPHLALYLAFLEVLRPARDDLNRLTQRHLDFFYRQVLLLRDRPSQADSAHLLFELAKTQTEYKLPTATRFTAGKDATGVELFYQLDAEVVIHKAQIASLKGLFLDSLERKNAAAPKNLLGLHVSPIANSLDGKGGKFPKEQIVKTWLPFGSSDRDDASLGLAIASDVLLLQEGRRVIQLKLSLSGFFTPIPVNQLHQVFTVYLSGEKEWITPDILPSTQTASNGQQTRWDGTDLYLVVELAPDVAPILPYRPDAPIPYDPKQPNLPLQLERPMPVVRLELNNRVLVDGRSPYHYFRDAEIHDITVQTHVDKVRNLVLQNDFGVLNPATPFEPFGRQPKDKANLYIGSQEVLQKNLTDLTISLELATPKPSNWQDIYAAYDIKNNFQPGRFTIHALRQKIWHPVVGGLTASLFDSSGISLTDKLASLHLNSFDTPEPVETWTPQSKTGFLRLQLLGSFLHEKYPTVLARQVLAAATNQTVWVEGEQKRQAVIGAYYRISDDEPFRANTYYVELNAEPILPPEPYLPVINSLSLSYTAQAEKDNCTLFHLHPFGGFERLELSKKPDFLPHFTQEGELLIGVQNLDPPTALPLLFQVAEETADTSLRREEQYKLQWYYLKDNTWESLGDRIVSDATNGLITSGIINLEIPADISRNQTTILDPNLYWLKVSILARSRTVCEIIGVHTQAARVTFTDSGNDPNRLAVPLPPGTISKLASPQPEIKKIEQPYASFGGRVKEQPEHFYTRISEHLRHKGRAVSIFDYERLVLEKFPQIYKVRCINHGQFVDSPEQLYELAPGSVTLAVIPDLSQRSTTNDLEPKININLLQEIEKYLASLSSPWVMIKVVNPQYERIQVEMQVKFKSPYDSNFGYYQRELQQAIIGFLTPWTVDTGADINFGGKVYRSSILKFVEEQYYVDYIINFKMHLDTQQDIREAIASTARSVLTSVSLQTNGQNHVIQEFEEMAIVSGNSSLASGVLGFESLDDLELG
ncbi:hypothetical protein F7734_37840 [Scytonema sp. UIC 10036]|uniref:baseplate J/gp47 family protein n=1 Tax=Scytonema sp. UIC 10036 TaxID=2304196 RepID=UPI0012DA8F6A|nr:baseplate J/gp47 family protein [Scytonema sp. UIC 10036]MUG97765.1 hypothetical protein [Scytonema sp. UIC 10036]